MSKVTRSTFKRTLWLRTIGEISRSVNPERYKQRIRNSSLGSTVRVIQVVQVVQIAKAVEIVEAAEIVEAVEVVYHRGQKSEIRDQLYP